MPIDSLELQTIATRCSQETERFFRKLSYDGQYCFELFRLALTERNQQAWDALYSQYDSLVIGWVKDHPQFVISQESAEFFVNGIFTSMWTSCTPERFTRFPNLAATLAYLKTCVHTTISNHIRKRRPPLAELNDEIANMPTSSDNADASPNLVLERIERDELWHLLRTLLKGEKEALVLDLLFIKGYKPREIFEQRPSDFETVREVYRIKQNLMERLARNSDLKAFYENR